MKDFINLMACADPQYMEPAHKCMDAFVAHLEHIGVEDHEQKRQIELTCCTFQLFQECIFTGKFFLGRRSLNYIRVFQRTNPTNQSSASKKINCPQRVVTADKAIDYVRTIINSMGGDLMDFMCGKYDSVPSCVAGFPKVMSGFKVISDKINNGTMKPKHNSPLKPMLQLFIKEQEEDLAS